MRCYKQCFPAEETSLRNASFSHWKLLSVNFIVGVIGGNYNAEITAKFSALLEKELGISKNRFYIKVKHKPLRASDTVIYGLSNLFSRSIKCWLVSSHETKHCSLTFSASCLCCNSVWSANAIRRISLTLPIEFETFPLNGCGSLMQTVDSAI